MSDDDDMALAPTIEEMPVPMSKNNVGSRWVCVVMDHMLYPGYDGSVWEGGDNTNSLLVEKFDDDLMDDDDDGEDVDVEEEDYEDGLPDSSIQDGLDVDMMDVKVPEFREEETTKKRTAFDFQTLEMLERHELDDTLEEFDNDHILWKMHNDRIKLTEEHVMWARKQNLYNETFNSESMADVLWSHQM